MTNELKLLLIVLVPVIGAFVAGAAGFISARLRNALSLIFVLVSFVLSLTLIKPVLAGLTITVAKQLPLGFNFILNADGLAVFMAIVSTLVSSLIVLYSFGYISHYENQNEYYLMVVLFIGSMMGLVFSGNLILLYVFWEITTITCWRLIGFFRKEDDVIKSNKAFLVTVFGALMMLIGFIMIYMQAGSFDLNVIKETYIGGHLPGIAVMLILFGILSKSATLPLHTWLPDAGVAPSPVTAILHAAVLVKIGVYVFARLFVVTAHIGLAWQVIVPLIAGASAMVAAGAALIETDMKRIIAYSTISQIGFIFLGLSVGSDIGFAGALLYILMHGIAKGGLFLCAGIVEQNAKTKDITKLGGLISTMPVTAISFLFCAFSVMGIPPFGGFFSKYMVIAGAVKSGHFLIGLFFIGTAFLTIIYLLRLFNLIFLGEQKINAKEGSAVMVFSVALLAVLSLVSGIFVKYPAGFVNNIVGWVWR